MPDIKSDILEAEIDELKKQLDRVALLIHGDGFALVGIAQRVSQHDKAILAIQNDIAETRSIAENMQHSVRQQRYLLHGILILNVAILTGREILDVIAIALGGG